jgi:hypothetical protein
MAPTGPSLLQELLAPTTPEHFFEKIWQRQALHSRGPRDRFRDLFDVAAFKRATGRCEVLKASSADAHGRPREFPLTPEAVDAAFRAGATICIGTIVGNAALDGFIARLSAEVVSAGGASFNAYYSPDGRGFGLHLDDHPVWILQIEGSKRWWYSSTPGITQPLTTVTLPAGVSAVSVPWQDDPVTRPDESSFESVVLEPGDALYLPQGAWHQAAAVGESLALTLAFGRATCLDLVQRAMGQRIAGSPTLRWNLPGLRAGDIRDDEVPAELAPAFQAALTELRCILSDLTAADLYRAWRDMARPE